MIIYELCYSTVKPNKIEEVKFDKKQDAINFMECLKNTHKSNLDYISLYEVSYKKIEI